MVNNKPSQLSSKEMFLKGTIIAAIITIPSLTVFFVAWHVLDDLITAAIIGVIIHFVSMGFSLKLSKKIFKSKIEPK